MSYQKNYPNGWKSGEAGGTPITPAALDNIENGIANALPKDGTDPMTADLPMGGHRVTGLGNPQDDGDAVPLGYANGHFAPAGYGLGAYAVNEIGYRQVNHEEADALRATTICWFRDDANPFYYDPWASGSAGVLIHIQHNVLNSDAAKQIFIPYYKCGVRDSDGPDSYVIVERTKRNSDGAWTPPEWRNPPMVPGVEYRTTERWNGSPVYRKIVSHTNSVTWAGNNTYPVAHGVSNLDVNNVEIVLKTAGYCMPYLGADGTTAVAFFDATHITVRTTGSVSWGSRNWYFEMKYTKSV